MGDRHPRAGRPRRHRDSRGTRQAARPEPGRHAAGRGADRRQGRHRRDDRRRHTEGALRTHRICVCGPRKNRRLRGGQSGCRAADGQCRCRANRRRGRQNTDADRQDAALLSGRRSATRRLRLPDRRARVGQAACRRKTVAGPAWTPVLARFRVRRASPGKTRMTDDAIATVPTAALDDCNAAGAITLNAISKWFDTAEGGPLTVLENIDLAIPAHSIFAILGASGCGKSTLLNIISGILTPDRGSVCFGGVRASDFTDWRSISYMFQEDRLLPWRTALANIEFSLEAGDMPRAERRARARDALHLVKLAGFEEAFPHQLSGGMRSRVALAR